MMGETKGKIEVKVPELRCSIFIKEGQDPQEVINKYKNRTHNSLRIEVGKK